MGWASTYETGLHNVAWPNAFPGVDHISGVEVEHDPSSHNGVLNFRYKLDLPSNGWADDATFNNIRLLSKKPGLTGGASHATTPPLSGIFNFVRDGYEYNILATEPGRYNLSRRADIREQRSRGWTTNNGDKIERIATVSREALHRSIAEGITRAVQNGLPAELDQHRFQAFGPLPPIDTTKSQIRRLRNQLTDINSALTKARRNAELAEDTEAAQLFIDTVNQQLSERTRIERRITNLESTVSEPQLSQTFETQTQLVTYAIAALPGAKNTADPALRAALRTIISKETWTATKDKVQWELSIELPHEKGTIILGPIRGEVENRKDNRDGSTAIYRQRQNARQQLTNLGLATPAARSALSYPNPHLTNLLTAHLTQKPLPTDFEPELATHLITIYTNPDFVWKPGRWRLNDQVRQNILTLISQAGGTLTQEQLIDAGYNKNQLRHLTRTKPNTPTGNPILTQTGKGPTSLYQLQKCPHCHGWCDHSILTPETKPGIICTTCWRTPTPNSPTYPRWYRTRL